MTARAVLAGLLALVGCVHKPPPAPPPSLPHFTVGNPYQTGGEWRYPRIFDSYDVTGLATIYPADRVGLTSDNETYDPQALAASSSVLQLPAIVTVTNLANGYSMDVRVNDRGPDDPGRILAVTPRVAADLRFPAGGVAQVEVTLDAQATAALDGALGQGPQLTAAPVAGITAQSLSPPGSSTPVGAAQDLTPAASAAPALSVTQLSGRLTAFPPSPGPLYVQIPGFGRVRDARRVLNEQLYGFPAEIVPVWAGDRTLYAINCGPYDAVADADAALRQVLARGIADPDIIIR